MKTVFEICSENTACNYSGQFDIITPYCNGQNLTWDLRMRKSDSGGIAFALILSSPNIVVPCAKFSVKYVSSCQSDLANSGSFRCHQGYHSLTNVRFEFIKELKKFSHTAVNVKFDDVICVTLPNLFALPPDGRRVRCTINFPENASADFKELLPLVGIKLLHDATPSVAQKLLQDAVLSVEPTQFADVILTTADERKFHVHSCFLAKQSSVFTAMLQEGNFKEGQERQIKTPDINSETMEEVLRYVYTECVNLDALKAMAPEILYATEKYHLPEALKLMCVTTMIDSMNVSNALSCLITADMYSLDELKRCAIKVVVDNLKEIRQQEGWKEILKKQPDLVDEIFAFIAT